MNAHPRVAVVTIAHGRHDHLRNQHRGLRAGAVLLDDYVVVAMDDPVIAAWQPDAAPHPHTVAIERQSHGLPLAEARNLGARTALERGADLIVFLDVDCIPAPGLIEAYRDTASDPHHADTILCGPVAYLPPPPPGGYTPRQIEETPGHPARPDPGPGETVAGDQHDLFWSLSFATTAQTWQRIGGFHTEYVGYGAEDTDFGRTARQQGISITWVGSARAAHQHHPTETPPRQHLHDILRNGHIFAERWGEWPMRGWLDQFEREGLIVRDRNGYRPATTRMSCQPAGAGRQDIGGDDGNRPHRTAVTR